ncbi:MAG: DUF2784 family protein [Acidobacteriaceae bacterium]
MEAIATSVLLLHLAWIGLLIFGALWTRGRPFRTALHVLALVWGIVVEVGPWPCPLTLAEQYYEGRAGVQPYQGSLSDALRRRRCVPAPVLLDGRGLRRDGLFGQPGNIPLALRRVDATEAGAGIGFQRFDLRRAEAPCFSAMHRVPVV